MKLQILPLPEEYAGEYSATPYALIASEVPTGKAERISQALNELSIPKHGFPLWTLVTEDTVEL